MRDIERDHFRRLEPALRDAEIVAEATGESRRHLIAAANQRRAEAGIGPLQDDPEEPAELALYRRARALGRSSSSS